MDRRQFMRGVTAGTAGLGAAAAAPAARQKTVTYKVRGFSCVTCAVGLETMLRGVKGVVHVKASYPDSNVVIGFDDKATSEKALKAFIASCGFTVA